MSRFHGFFDPRTGTNQSLRIVAEKHSPPSAFTTDLAYSTQAGCPVGNAGGTYKEVVVPRGPSRQQDDKNPFQNLKGG